MGSVAIVHATRAQDDMKVKAAKSWHTCRLEVLLDDTLSSCLPGEYNWAVGPPPEERTNQSEIDYLSNMVNYHLSRFRASNLSFALVI